MGGHFYVYVLRSTKDLPGRLEEHQGGKVLSPRNRRPLILVHWEGCLTQKEATLREKYLKNESHIISRGEHPRVEPGWPRSPKPGGRAVGS